MIIYRGFRLNNCRGCGSVAKVSCIDSGYVISCSRYCYKNYCCGKTVALTGRKWNFENGVV